MVLRLASLEGNRIGTISGILQFFVYLQVLDLLTTLIGFRVGAAEASPFIRSLMHAGPALGVCLSKLIALAIGAVCVCANKWRALQWITVASAALVAWNLVVIFVVANGHPR